MKQRWLVLTLMFGLFLLTSGAFCAEKVVIYGHISFVEEGVSVVRGDGMQMEEVVVNLPVAAGDTITTNDRARCEIQGDNGTIIRLDQNTEIKFETVLAQSLTTRWKITTIRLVRGNLYTINNVYKQEMVQVCTSNAAIRLKNTSKCLIYLDKAGETELRVLLGKVYVMYGAEGRSFQVDKLTKGEEARVTVKNELVFEPVGDADFYLWNEGLNRNFEEMHAGISKLPKPLYRYPRALIDWAENWSSRYGNWVYDDFFGYVWHPYHEQFANVHYSPFFNAKYVTIGGNFYMVPQEPWGWVPMYLGIWHWNPKYGWIWIPGNAFHYDYFDVRFPFYGYRTLWDFYYPDMYNLRSCWPLFWYWENWFYAFSYYGNWSYTGWYLYPYLYRYYGWWWRPYGDFDYYAYYSPYGYPDGRGPLRIPKLVLTPKNLKDDHSIPPEGSKIIRRINRLSEDKRKEILGKPEEIEKFAKTSKIDIQIPLEKSGPPAGASKSRDGLSENPIKGTVEASPVHRDWNPDWRWAQKHNIEVKLNRTVNGYACPKLDITAAQVNTGFEKMMLRAYGENYVTRMGRGSSAGGSTHESSGSISSHSSSSGASNSSGSVSSHSSSSSSGSVSSHKKD